tara:strand:+ start:9342 stop:11315 length:1974 start_codon:yes stop_codon:yes gene_type:complete
MGVSKSFVVKNGLEVNQGLIFADIDTQKVGIGSTVPEYDLDLYDGDVRSRDVYNRHIYSTGIGTFASASLTDANIAEDLKVGTGGTVLTALVASGSVGIGSNVPRYSLDVNSSVSTGQTAIYSYGDFEATGNITGGGSITGGGNLSIGGSTTIDESLTVSGLSTFTGAADFNNNVDIDGHTELDDVNVSGASTFTGAIDANGGLNVSGATTISSGDFTVTSGNVTMSAGDLDITGNLDVSGISSVGSAITMYGSSGIISATAFYGDGANLDNTISGVGIQTNDNNTVGYGITFLHLKGPGISTSQYDSSAGVATVFILGPGELSIPDNFITTSMLSTGGPVWNDGGDLYVSGVATATEFKVGTAVTINSSGIDVTGIVTGTSFDGNVTLNDLQVTYSKLSTGRPEWNTFGDLFIDRHIFASSGVTTASSFFTPSGIGSVTSPNFYGDLTGTADVSTKVKVTNDTSGTGYLIFNDYSTTSSTVGRDLKTNANLLYNATDNELTVDAIKSEIHATGLVKEKFVTNTASNGLFSTTNLSQRIELQHGMIHRCTSLNGTIKALTKITYSDGTDLADHMAVGESCTVILILTCSATQSPYISDASNGIYIDGYSQSSVYWTNGVAPTSGSSSGFDVYTFTILRTSVSNTGWQIYASVQNSAL